MSLEFFDTFIEIYAKNDLEDILTPKIHKCGFRHLGAKKLFHVGTSGKGGIKNSVFCILSRTLVLI